MPTGENENLIGKDIARPEYLRRVYYLATAFATLMIISFLPNPEGLPIEGQRAVGILAFVTILWVTETFPLGLTALFGTMLLPIFGILEPSNAFTGFGSPALFFLIGALSLGIAIQKTNLHKRISLLFLRKFGKSSSSMIFSVCILGGFMAMTIPAHAVAALLLPVLMGMVKAGGVDRRNNFGIAIFLALTYATSVGSIGTLLGGARNVLAIGILESTVGVSLSFVDWLIAGAPIAIILMILTFIVLRIVYPWEEVDVDRMRTEMKEEVSDMGGISEREKKAAGIFGLSFVLWVVLGTEIGLATVAVGALILLVVTRTITWRDIEQNMPWGLLFLYGGAITLSQALRNTQGISFITTQLIGFIGQNSFLIIVMLLVLVVLLSNLMSNSAATVVVLPIALITLIELGYPGQLPSYLIAMGSAMAFMLPIATPSAAIVYSSGYVKVKDLVKGGAVLSIISVITFITVGLGWWKLLGIW